MKNMPNRSQFFSGSGLLALAGLVLIASAATATAQLPPGAPVPPGLIVPQNVTPPLAANGLPETGIPAAPATPAASAATPEATAATAPASPPPPSNKPGEMVLGQKIDTLTLEDLQDKLQASPDMIFRSASMTYQAEMLQTLNDKLAATSGTSQ